MLRHRRRRRLLGFFLVTLGVLLMLFVPEGVWFGGVLFLFALLLEWLGLWLEQAS